MLRSFWRNLFQQSDRQTSRKRRSSSRSTPVSASVAHRATARDLCQGIESLENRALLTILTVTSLADTIANDGQVTLREAIQAANTDTTVDGITGSGADTIQFAPSLTSSGPATITLSGTELAITTDLNIVGPGADRLAIDGNQTSGIFRVADNNNSSTNRVLISGLTITNGLFGITNVENLTLRQSTVSRNKAISGGGGIGNGPGGILTVDQCSIVENGRPAGGGAGISNSRGTLTILRSQISGNVGTSGGGVVSYYGLGTLTIANSTITGNIASTGSGGGIKASGPYGTSQPIVISQCTISGNIASGAGGGIDSYRSTLSISQTTIVANSTGGTHPDGGGIRLSYDVITTLTNTIVAGNTRRDGTADDLGGGGPLSANSKNNLIGDPRHAAGLTNGVNGNIVGMSNGTGGRTLLDLSTVLFPAATNFGGATPVIPLVSGSPALDAGNNTLIPVDVADSDGDTNLTEATAFDQRGSGFDRVLNGAVDIGASEGVILGTAVALTIPQPKVKEDGSINLRFQFTRSRTDGALTVYFAVSGTAVRNGDFTTTAFSSNTGSVTFADGSSTATVVVNPMADSEFEDNETVTLTLMSGSDYVVSTMSTAAGIIATDEIIVVDTLEDTDDGNHTAGDWSLREAILLANSNPGADTIVFAPSLMGSGSATITLTQGELRISDDLSIQGPTTNGLTISGNNASRIFIISDDTYSYKVVSLRNLTMTDGRSSTNSGGAIKNSETLTISSCVITNCSANLGGGAIDARANVTIEQSTLTNNFSANHGGAILAFYGQLTIRQSTIVNNTATSGGGGVFNINNTLDVRNTIIAGNTRTSDVPSDIEGDNLATTSRNNIIGSPTFAGGLANGVNGNVVGQANGSGRSALDLATVLDTSLADNGGPTKTLTLMSGSIAIDAGDNASLSADTFDRDGDGSRTEADPFDQRGSGFARVLNGTVDIGAIELGVPVSQLSIAATSAAKSEGTSGNTAFTFTVSRRGSTTGSASVNYAVAGIGTNAADAADFGGTFPSGTVNFPAGETTQTLTINVSGDTTAEFDDSFAVRLSNPTGATLNTASTNLVVNGDFEAGDTSFSSSHRSRPNTLDSLHSAGDYTVTADPRFVHGQFASYADHTPGSGTFMLVANGATTPIAVWGQTVAVTPNTTYQFAAYGSTTVVDTATLRFEINGVEVGILNVPAVTGQWTPLTATWNSGSATTADLKIINLSVASNGNDFALDDISFGTATGTPTAVGIILNDDSNSASLSIAATNASRLEGNSGSTAFTFSVTRTGDTSGTASTNFAVTGSGSNLANASDFGGSLPSGTINFAAGETTKTLTINVSGDTTVEPNEGFTVTLSNAVGASIGTASVAGTIRNDDSSLSIAATSALNPEGNSGMTPFTFTVTRTGTLSGTASVEFAVTGSGTIAADAGDFGGVLPSGTISFAAGETTKTLTIDVSADTITESDEGFTVTLSNPSGANLGTALATGAIRNDDVNVLLDASGNLRIRDHVAGGRADQLTVSFDVASQEIVIRDPQNILRTSIGTIVSAQEIRVARAEITGNGLHVELNGGADQLDLSALPAGVLTVEVNGGDGNDTIVGHAGADLIQGGFGDDSVSGGDGNDTLWGSNGHDVLRGEAGHDVLRGQMNNDRLFGGDGDDTCDGGAGNDTLLGDAGNDRLLGISGNDVISGGDGRDKIFGGDGHDSLGGNSGNDQIIGGLGNDTVDGGAGNDDLDGQAGNDLLNGSNGDDTLQGGLDDDTLIGLSGNDRLDGGDGHDLEKGGDGNDTLLGGNGNDILSGSVGDDLEEGGDGDDTIAGGDGNDTLAGGTGNDYVHGDLGLDDLHGNDGDDSLHGGTGNDVISGDAGNDILVGGENNDTLFGGADNDWLIGKAGDDQLTGGTGDDTLAGGSGTGADSGDVLITDDDERVQEDSPLTADWIERL